jgi:DNA-binding NtrC family response regulator
VGRILIVDDEPEIRSSIGQALTAADGLIKTVRGERDQLVAG